MKSYQFIKIYIRFYKKREKTVIQQSMRKTEKSWTLFYLTGYFMKPLKMIINQFFFNRAFCSQDVLSFRQLVHREIFVFRCQDDLRNIKIGNWKRQIARNRKLRYLFQK